MNKTRKNILISALLCVLLLAAIIAVFEKNASKKNQQDAFLQQLELEAGSYHPQRIILQDISLQTAEELADSWNATVRQPADGRSYVFTLPQDTSIQEVVAESSNATYVTHMSADYYAQLSGDSTSDDCITGAALLEDINLQDTWDVTTGTGITIAVIDTGIDIDSDRFTGRISSKSYNATRDQVVADYDWSIIDDEHGHGTAVASILAASPDETTSICGVAPGAELLVIKCEPDSRGNINISDMIFAMAYAIECDVDIIHMSFGSSGGSTNPFERYTRLAVDSDILCVAAAGNNGSSVLTWPAADPDVIGVGALEDSSKAGGTLISGTFGDLPAARSYTLYQYSNYGDNSDVVAPQAILAESLNGAAVTCSGTSASTAVVSGAAALYLSQNKYTEVDDFRQMLFASSADMGTSGEDWYYGYGMIDVHALVVEEKGTITLDYLTDELENQQIPFVLGHKIQSIDEPERNYVVFDGWYYDINCTDEFDYLTDSIYRDITLYAKWENEDDTLPYTYRLLNEECIEITAYLGKRRYIVIPETIDGYTVTSIGSEAFRGNNRLREIVLPDTLTAIEDYAFADCPRLLSIAIPENVTIIGKNAFENDSRLAEVIVATEAALESIGERAFAYCGTLQRFDIPDNLQEITGSAFYGASSMHQITAADNCQNFEIVDNALCSKGEQQTLVYYPAALMGEYAVPEEVSSVGEYAFSQSRLSAVQLHAGISSLNVGSFTEANIMQITLPAGITEIPEKCFEKCRELTAVTLPDGLVNVKDEAFSSCESLVTINFPESLTEIGNRAFSDNSSLSEISCGTSRLQKIGSFAFSACFSLTDIRFIGEKIEIISQGAFSGCRSLTEVTLPLSLRVLEQGAFQYCTDLAQVQFADGIVLANREDTSAYDYAENILSYALFNQCTHLQQIQIPASIEILDGYCLGATGLTSIEIGTGIKEIRPAALVSCINLTQITVAEDNPTHYATDNVLYTVETTVDETTQEEATEVVLNTFPAGLGGTFTVPAGVKHIGNHAFACNMKLTAVTLNSELRTIRNSAFYATFNLNTVNYQDGLVEIGSNAFNHCRSLTAQEFPASLQTIGPYAFEYCSGLKEVIFSKDLISIGYQAFNATSNLSRVTFPEDCVISRLGNGAFSGSGITSIEIPTSVSSMGQSVFANCMQLTEVSFAPNSRLTHLAAWVFQGADNLKSITFGEGSALENIEARALEYLYKLENINLESCHHLTNIDNYSFQFCESLAQLQLPENVSYIGRYAFYACSSLSELVIPESVEYIGRYAFTYTNQIRLLFSSAAFPQYLQDGWDYGIGGYYLGTDSIITDGDWDYALLPDGSASIVAYHGAQTVLDLTTVCGYPVSSVGISAFEGNTSVEQITLPETLLSICDRAFAGTSSLQCITIPSSVTYLGSSAFDGSSVAQVTFGEGIRLETIQSSTFASTPHLQSITIPATVETIKPYAFYGSALSEVFFPEDSCLTLIGRHAFADSGLQQVALPKLLQRVDYYAFSGIDTLHNVTFSGETELSLYGYAFYNSGLTQLHLPANVHYVGEFAFVNCTKLPAIEVAEDNPYYASSDGVLFNKERTRIVCCPAGKTGTYTIPAEVSVLGFAAFEGSQLSSVIIPETSALSTLGYRAFFNCGSLTSIHIPATVVSIDYYAFAYCSNLHTVTIDEASRN